MKFLLDTHVFLWAITDDSQLSPRAREIFLFGRNELFVSVASVWEIVIKVHLKRLPLPKPVVPYLLEQFSENQIQVLPIRLNHIARLEELPLHHRDDPFDRILISQSMEEDWPLLSADPLLEKYPATLVW